MLSVVSRTQVPCVPSVEMFLVFNSTNLLSNVYSVPPTVTLVTSCPSLSFQTILKSTLINSS
ncbi:hypothetical protein [Clostridium gasigenes]|uniref:hypothetical protein n=1 Tax=Clostridium gasigenes TaxID=94869 RepID=UPI00209B50EB|nr:hypothetical protein [Clostridium gasigenes]